MADLDFLRGYFDDSLRCRSLSNEAKRDAAVRRGATALAWAKTVDTDGAPVSMEDAIVRGAACLFKRAAREHGEHWAGEVLVSPPEQTEGEPSGCWRLCWESGPYQWGITDSFGGGAVVPKRYCWSTEHGWYTEPYHSFDLCYTR